MGLKVPLLSEEAGQVGEMQRPLDSKPGELASMEQALLAEEAVLKENIHHYGRLKLKMGAARAVIYRGKVSCLISPSELVPGTLASA